MNRMKIKGITGMPLLFSFILGWFDGKRGAVTCSGQEGWSGHYIDEKSAAYRTFVHALYGRLEQGTAPLHEESAALITELKLTGVSLALPDQTCGSTPNMQKRSAGRAAGSRSALTQRRRDIRLRLPVIEEALTHAICDAAADTREAAELTKRRLHAYLRGACHGLRSSSIDTRVSVSHPFDEEKNFLDRHNENDTLRRRMISAFLEEEESQ